MTKANDGDRKESFRIWQFLLILLSFLGVFYILFMGIHICPQSPIERKNTVNQLAQIEAALDEFKILNGYYPDYTGSDPIEGGAIMWAELTASPESRVREEFRDQGKRKVIDTIDGVETLVDYWGDPIHYRCEPVTTPREEKSTKNPTYDLWSTGGDPENPPKKWITNWGN